MASQCPQDRAPRARWIVLIGAAAVLLSGCGQRGALFMPAETRNVVVTAPPAATTEAAPESTEEQRRDKPTTPAK